MNRHQPKNTPVLVPSPFGRGSGRGRGQRHHANTRNDLIPVPAVNAHRGGYLYVGVMMVSLVVSAAAFGALAVSHLSLRLAREETDQAKAMLMARSGLEHGLNQIKYNSNWRNTYTHNVEDPEQPYGINGGTFTFRFIDFEDTNLANDPNNACYLEGIGRCGDAVYVERVLLQPAGRAINSLDVGMHSFGSINVTEFVKLECDYIVSSNGSIDATSFLATLDGDAEAVGTINGNITGTETTSITPREMPGADVFEYYKNNGTWIDYTALNDLGSGFRGLHRGLLTPAFNPFGGDTNPQGIYVIDCANQQVRFSDVRIWGTLVLLNCPATSKIESGVIWEPYVPNFPALLVDGAIEFRQHAITMSEDLVNVNYNPPGSPIDGVSDGDQTDNYPSLLKGLVYVSNTARFPPFTVDSHFEGSLVCGTLTATAPATMVYSPLFKDNPPPGFAVGPEMTVSRGSWQRGTAP